MSRRKAVPLQGEKPLTHTHTHTHRVIFLVTSSVRHTAVGISTPADLPCNMPQRRRRWKGLKVKFYPFSKLGDRWRCVCLTPRPTSLNPGKEPWYHLYSKLLGPGVRFGRMRNMSPHRCSNAEPIGKDYKFCDFCCKPFLK